MAQYESGQYINEFLNEMPTLLLTLRKQDIDQHLQTRRLDQQDVVLGLDQQRVNIQDRQIAMAEDIFGTEKREREAVKTGTQPLFQAEIQRKKLEEEEDKQLSEMPWTQRLFRGHESGEGWIPGVESETERARRLAKEKVGDVPTGSELMEQILPQLKENPALFRELYNDPMFRNLLMSNSGLFGTVTAPPLGGFTR